MIMENITLSKKNLTLVLLLLFTAAIGFAQNQTFNTSGTFTPPAGVTVVTVEAWGGGGKGGSRTASGVGGGGGGGGYTRKVMTVVPGNNYNVVVGNGSTTSSVAGGDTYFIDNTTVLAKGGNSVANNSAAGAAGGATTIYGDTSFAGGNGATGVTSFYGGGGGSSAGTGSNGGNGFAQNGGSAIGAGDGGDGRTSNSGDGIVGSVPGGGGGGSYRSSGTRLGGNGGNGRVYISWVPEINIEGNSINIADGDASPSTADWTDFGGASVGTTITKTFTIENLGTTTLTIGAITFSGTNASEFTVTTAPASSVAPYSNTTFVVTFNPAAIGTRTAAISIVNNDATENPYNFSIQGNAINPEINVKGNTVTISDGNASPSAADWTSFGTTNVASGTLTRTFTIENTGTSSLTISGVSFSGANAGDFSVTTAPAGTVTSGSTTTFVVTFNPSAAGSRTATISIANNDANENPYTFAVDGDATDPEINVQGNSSDIADGNLTPAVTNWTDFGTVNITSGTIARTFTIENKSSATMALSIIGSISITGANAADFTVTTAPAASVAIGGSTTFIVTFNPSASGTRTATVSITNNDSNESPYTFSIQGSGTDPEINVQGLASNNIGDGDITPSAVDGTIFGSIDIASGTILRTFTIQNTGNEILNITAVNITGVNAADFSMTTAPASTVAAGGNTTFVVTFDPTTVGVKNATITITNNDASESSYDFAIQGTATDPEINIQGNGNAIADGNTATSATDWTSFGTTDITSGTITRTFTIQNLASGTGALTIGAITFSGANAADFSVTTAPASSVANNSTTTFVVTFNPSGFGTRTATISIANTDSNENPYDFAISGVGGDSEITVYCNGGEVLSGTLTTNALNTSFGSTDIGAGTITRTFSILNLATATMTLNLGAITFSGANAGDFTVTTAPGVTTIPVSSSTAFVVTFNPSAVGVRNATMSIVNNDSNENPYTFAISGIGADPEIDIQGNAVSIVDGDATPSTSDWTDYGNIEISAGTATRTYTIYNSASASMALSVGAITFSGTNPGDFSVTTTPASTVAIGGSTTFTVTFNPSATGTRSAVLSMINNDATENPYNFSIQGTGTNPEINVVGNLISIADGDTTPSVSDNTDFGTVSIDSGSTLVTYTIHNTGTGIMNIGSTAISGANASDFVITSYPTSTIAGGGSTTLVISFSPAALGTKTATITIINDDANENPYDFSITGFGVRTYTDTDGDNITDNIDIDDDNDGILDVTEELECRASVVSGYITHTFLNETFGAGTTKGLININIPNATCGYCYEDGVAGPNTTACPSQSSWILDDGEYVVTYKIAGTTAGDPENIHGDLAWNGLVDHTIGDTNGRMAVFNASYTPGTFYETAITGIIPNAPITYSFYVLNIMSVSNYTGSILPNITVEFLDTVSGAVLSTYNTGNIGRCNGGTGANGCTYSEWQYYSTTVNLGTVTNFTIRFKNNSTGGGGNDLAIDDILLTQQYCDREGDGIANLYDLDSDNDGIPDIEEGGYKGLSSGKSTMDRTLPSWADANGNGMLDSIDAAIAAGTYSIADTDSDGTKDFQDLDSDNDSMFDVDESGIFNGDGDINGDGFGDGLDTDKDGILDLFDTSVAFGTAVRTFATDTNNDGVANYLDIDANTDGVKDILTTLYGSFDANLDGKIDGTADADRDGILDSFDTKTNGYGSPRDLNRKLFLDFDGRNDYGEAPQMLSGLGKSTIMGWIKLSSPYTATGFVIGQDNFNLKVDTSSGTKLTATANGVTLTYGTALSVNRWYHIAAVYDGSNATAKLKLFVNGQEEAASNAGALSGSLAASAAKFTFGKNATSAAQYFKGSIEEVRIFNTALTTDQLQKMVYQEIKQNGTAIRGEIVPKDIESSLWANVLAYYRMDAYKDDVIDNYTTGTVDSGISASFAKIYNHKVIAYQLAPMPFVTTLSTTLDAAVSQNNFVYGNDLFTYNWSILQMKHNIDLPFNITTLGLFVDPTVTFNLINDNMVKNTWYLLLNGKMDLQGKSQLVQTGASDLDPVSSGYIERDQQGSTNKWNYNYWGSPVGAVNNSTNNNAFTVASGMKDGTNAANPQNIQWTTGLNSSATSPITLSSYWIFKFQNVTNAYANWATVGPNGSLATGQGFTLKGSSAATSTQNYVFIGKPNTGVVSIPVASGNLNLCGNPYASAIDADKFITDNLSITTGTLYFWEHFSTNTTHVLADYQGGYATRTLVGGTTPVSPSGVSNLGTSSKRPGQFIPVGQGFFVTANATGGDIKFNNDQRAFVKEDNINSNTVFRNNSLAATPEDAIYNNNEDGTTVDTFARVRVGFNSVNSYHREVLIGFMDSHAGPGIDPGYDARHIDNQPNDMYFMTLGEKLNIQGDGYFNTANIYPIGVKSAGAGAVSFTLDGLENFPDNQPVYIYDNVTQQYHNIREEKFDLTVEAGTVNDRFSLRFTTGTSLGTGEVILANGILAAYTNANSTLTIKNNVTDVTIETISLYNLLGQAIATWDVENQEQQNIEVPVKNLSTGTYIVKMKTTKGDLSKKIIIK
jgi:hypothetical protein